jgi:hypothetical protein
MSPPVISDVPVIPPNVISYLENFNEKRSGFLTHKQSASNRNVSIPFCSNSSNICVRRIINLMSVSSTNKIVESGIKHHTPTNHSIGKIMIQCNFYFI